MTTATWLAAALLAAGASSPRDVDPPFAAADVPAPIRQAAAAPRTLTVGPGGRFASVQAALDAARAGDTVRLAAGVYVERPVVRTRVVLTGESGAVIDAGGSGVALTIAAPGTVVSGLTLRGSGASLAREDAGILVTRADGVRMVGNRIEDVLFGIYVKQSRDPVIAGNTIVGKDLPVPNRGDGIRLWYCRGGRIVSNRVVRTRDVVIWFSNDLLIRGNRVADGRYGLHYMYSDHNRFERNEFADNRVGAFIMYSSDIELRDNVFANAVGASGMGIGLKDADAVVAEGNVLVRNAVGVYLDNSPRSEGVQNAFRGNVIAFNDIGISLLPSVHSNAFVDNTFLDNVEPVGVSGGGTATANRWHGNHWSGYAGFDSDDDGTGDTPFVHERLAGDLLAKHPELRLYALGPAVTALEALGRMFPLLRPEPIVVDSAPRLEPRLASDAVRQPEGGGPAAALALAASAVSIGLALRLRRPGRRRP